MVELRVNLARLVGGCLDDEDGCCSSSDDEKSGSGAARFLPLRSGVGSLMTIPVDVDAFERRVL